MEIDTSDALPARILYTNYRHETAWRHIQPLRIWHGSTEWHKQQQWFLKAIDTERGIERDFAMADIKEWQGEVPTTPTL